MARLAMFLVLVVGTLCQEQSDIARWIADLGHEEIAKREEALRVLLKAGPKALPVLEKAHKTAIDLPFRNELAEIIRRIGENEHEKVERRRKLELLSFDSPETTLHDVIAAVEKGSRFKVWTGVDRDQKVRVQGKDQPLRKVMDAIEDQLGLWIHEKEDRLGNPRWILDIFPADRPARPPRVVIAGATFTFAKVPHEVEGKFAGWIIETEIVGSASNHLASIEAEGSDGKALRVQVCAGCGPKRVLIRLEKPEAVRLRFKGTLAWECPSVFTVADLEKPAAFRLGLFSIGVEFPRVRITSATPVDFCLFARMEGDFREVREETWTAPEHADFCGSSEHTGFYNHSEKAEQVYDLEKTTIKGPWKIEILRPVQESFDERVTIPAD